MQRYIAAFLVAIVMSWAATACGQAGTDSSGAQKPARWALQFAVNNEQISAYLGTAISLKRKVSEGSSWRVGISVAVDPGSKSEEAELRIYESPRDTISSSGNSTSSSSYSLSVRWQWLRDIRISGRSTGFWGIGPVASYYHNEYASVSISNGASAYTDRRDDYTAGAVVSLGVEWRPAENLGLVGEYGLQSMYVWSEDKYVRRDVTSYERRWTRITKTDGVRIDATSVRLGLSLYF